MKSDTTLHSTEERSSNTAALTTSEDDKSQCRHCETTDTTAATEVKRSARGSGVIQKDHHQCSVERERSHSLVENMDMRGLCFLRCFYIFETVRGVFFFARQSGFKKIDWETSVAVIIKLKFELC